MSEAESSGRVYYVCEYNSSVEVKSVAIAKESDRALVLQDTLMAAPANRPKKVLFKGVDPIALNEHEALTHYLNAMRQQIVDLEFAIIRAQQLIECATELNEGKYEAAQPPATTEGVSAKFISDHQGI